MYNYPPSRLQNVRVDRRLIEDDLLVDLSFDALKLLVTIEYFLASSGRREDNISWRRFERLCGLTCAQIIAAQDELQKADLIMYQIRGRSSLYGTRRPKLQGINPWSRLPVQTPTGDATATA